MSEPRKKPGAAFWATVVVALVLAYPLTFGPACWLCSQPGRGQMINLIGGAGPPVAPRIYWPIGWLAHMGPPRLSRLIFWYATAGGRRYIAVPIESSTTRAIIP